MNQKEILEGLSNRAYDFIASHYYEISKEDLKDIILELLAMFEGAEYERIKKDLVKNLKEYKSWDEE